MPNTYSRPPNYPLQNSYPWLPKRYRTNTGRHRYPSIICGNGYPLLPNDHRMTVEILPNVYRRLPNWTAIEWPPEWLHANGYRMATEWLQAVTHDYRTPTDRCGGLHNAGWRGLSGSPAPLRARSPQFRSSAGSLPPLRKVDPAFGWPRLRGCCSQAPSPPRERSSCRGRSLSPERNRRRENQPVDNFTRVRGDTLRTRSEYTNIFAVLTG